MGHALQIATRGIYQGSTIGLSSSGYIIKITETLETPTKFKAAVTRYEEKSKKKPQKCVKIEVMYDKEIFELTRCIDHDIDISIDDVEVIERDGKVVEVLIKNPGLSD